MITVMLKNILYLLLGAIITILIFSGIFAGLVRPQRTAPASPFPTPIAGQEN